MIESPLTPAAALAFGFLSPGLLGLGALAAVPVLIYLWNRQRYRPMPWAAMAFVVSALKQNRRRLKLENLILLLVRILIVLLLVLAFARPVLERSEVFADLGAERRSVVFVLDRSYSMAMEQGGQSAFERAREATIKLARAVLREGDRFEVLFVGEDPVAARGRAGGGPAAALPGAAMAAAGAPARLAPWLYGSPVRADDDKLRRLAADLAEQRPLAVPGDMVQTLGRVAAYLPRFDEGVEQGAAAAKLGGRKQVFVVSDLQRSMFVAPAEAASRGPALTKALADIVERGGEVTFLDASLPEPANIGVTSLRADAEVAAVGQPVLFTATVQSFASKPLDLEAALSIEGRQVRVVPLRLEPGDEQQVDIYGTFEAAGAGTATLEVRTDGLLSDNSRHVTVDVRDALDVVLVDGERKPGFGESETDYLAIALAPAGDRLGPQLVRPRVVDPGELEGLDLDQAEVLVLANVLALGGAGADMGRLETFVRRGGGLLIFLGPQVDAAVWNEALWKDGQGLLPARLGEVVERPATPESPFFRLRADLPAHPLLSPFADREAREELTEPRFTAFVELAPPLPADDKSVQVLASLVERQRLPDGREVEVGEDVHHPVLIERRFGRGRVVLFGSTADNAWSNFPAQFAYLMLWQRAAAYLAEAGTGERNLEVGAPFEAILPASDFVPEVQLTTPEPDRRTLSLRTEDAAGEDDRIRLRFEDTRAPGVYGLQFVRRLEGGVAEVTRRDAFAVNVDPAEGDLRSATREELAQAFPGLAFQARPVTEVDRLAGVEGGATGLEVWRHLVWVVLGLLVLESALGCWFGRRSAS